MNKFEENAQAVEESMQDMQLYAVHTDDNFAMGDHLTAQQRLRDAQVTELLTQYVNAYRNKIGKRTIQRWMIMGSCFLIVVAILFCCVFSTIVLLRKEQIELTALATLITAYISGFSGVGYIFKTVVQYLFPKDEEQYITQIVKLIQEHDLQNKKLNLEIEMEKEKRKSK